MNLYKIILFLLFPVCCLIQTGAAQSNPYPVRDSGGVKTVTMPAGKHFAATKSKQFWWGKHWREEWLTPVTFPVFNMDTTAGGLTPLKRGGGHETKTLRMAGKNGREYVLRTIDKSVDVLIPEEFKGSFVNDLINDQISTAHPYGPIVVAALSESLGILHTNPIIAFVPDDPKLGPFKNDFANKLCLFEERPSGDGWENTALTGYASDIDNSEKLFEKLREDNKKQVDEKEYLKIRLFDMLINDWDRHDDQWVWTAQKRKGRTVYKPFARDRDQSFSKTDGVSLYFLSRPWALRSIQHLHPTLPDVIGSNLSATSLDRQFMVSLTEQDWRNTIAFIQQALPDSAILHALHKMPESAFRISGDFLYQRLRARRDNMMKYGIKYFRILSRKITLKGTDERELFTVHRPDNRTTEITIQALNKKSRDTLFHRIFDKRMTRSVNIYGLGGNDQFIYTGKPTNRILVRTLGGDGHDGFADSVETDGRRSRKTIIYDSPADAPAASNAFRYRSTTDTAITSYHPKGFKYDWYMPLLLPGYNVDDGVLIGAAFTYRKQEWNKSPFAWQQTIGGSYAAATGAFNVYYRGVFTRLAGKWDLDLNVNYKAPSFVVNFYGFGNGTSLVNKTKAFYRIRATSFLLNPSLNRTWNKNMLSAGLVFNTIRVEPAVNKFINLPASGIDSAVYTTKTFAGPSMAYTLNTSNSLTFPTKGVKFTAGASYQLNLKDTKRNFADLQSGFTFYYTPLQGMTIAHRTGASTNIGDYEFYQANTLGGLSNLRGYWRTRFTGRSMFYQNTDLRIKVAQLKGYVIRGSLGAYAFFDDGRIWDESDQSNTLHTGYGCGVYFIPYNKLALNMSVGSSREVTTFTFRTGFLF